ncbi:MAG: hypothetical protein HRT89_19840 [Lentisphaeria bacterium]|nr:hypothetical protein [Lentisphaeria bacterium]NQZ70310.1 hypothetical protein [Lentisphaeria bacterium]
MSREKDPNQLMNGISDTRIAMKLLLSVAFHCVLFLVTSIGFITLCMKHNTMDPRPIVKAIQDKADAEKKEVEAKAKIADAVKNKAKKDAEKDGKTSSGKKSSAKEGDKNLSKIEQGLKETSKERPTDSNTGFGEADFD